jgi:hypothetical protein
MEVSGYVPASAALPAGKEPTVLNKQDSGWASQLVRMHLRREFVGPVGNRTKTRRLVTIPTVTDQENGLSTTHTRARAIAHARTHKGRFCWVHAISEDNWNLVNKISLARFEVVTAMLMNVKVFWNFEPWRQIPDLSIENTRFRPSAFLTNAGKHIYEKHAET